MRTDDRADRAVAGFMTKAAEMLPGPWFGRCGLVIHRGGLCILFFLVCIPVYKGRKRFQNHRLTWCSCYRFMVTCYRFMVSRLQIYGHLLQIYGVIHRRTVELLQIYGPGWGICSGICFATNLWSPNGLGLLLQIYGRHPSATDLWSSEHRPEAGRAYRDCGRK